MSLGEIATFSRWFALGNLAVGRGWCGVVSAATEWLVSPLTLLVVGSRLKECLASLDACVPVGGILRGVVFQSEYCQSGESWYMYDTLARGRIDGGKPARICLTSNISPSVLRPTLVSNDK